MFFIGLPRQFFHICFSSSSVNAKKKFWGVPHLLLMCAIFSSIDHHLCVQFLILFHLKKSSFYMCTKNQSHDVWFHLLPFYSPLPTLMIWKIRILKKWKKHLEISSFYTCVPKITITCMLPKIWSATDIIFCHFGSFFALLHHYWPQKLKVGKNLRSTSRYYTFTLVHHKWRSYDVWFLRYEARQNFFCHFGPFLAF